jgi:hypothetical protein
MAEPKATLPSGDVTSGLNALQSLPVVGPGANNMDALQASLVDAQTALEQRYANPNWFNVAAGFFKPQLGGFAASLGSAAQELGNFTEQQRANQIPLFNVRAQVGAMQAQRKNREAAAEVYNAWDKGDPKNPNSVPRDPKTAGDVKAQVTSYGAPELASAIDAKIGVNKEVAGTNVATAQVPEIEARTQELLGNTPRAQQELKNMAAQLDLTVQELTNKITENGLTKQQIEEAIARTALTQTQIPQVRAQTALTGAETQQVKLKTSLEAQTAQNDSLFLKAPPGSLPNDWAVNSGETRKQIINLLAAKGLTTPENAQNLTNKQLMDAMNGMSETYMAGKIKNRDTAGQVVESTQGELKDYSIARDLVTSPKMSKLLGIGAGQEAMSALFGYFANPTDGSASSLNKAAAQLRTADPQLYADFATLNKTLQRSQMRTRAALENPSVGAQALVSRANPSTYADTQLAITKMLDLMAHDASMQNREAALRMGWSGDYNEFVSNPKSGYSALIEMGQEEARAIARSPTNLDSALPDFYRPTKRTSGSAAAPVTPAANTERPFHYEYNSDRTQRRKVYD